MATICPPFPGALLIKPLSVPLSVPYLRVLFNVIALVQFAVFGAITVWE